MKVIIQVPCFNEEATLGATLDAIPHTIPGVDVIEILIVNDGSGDATEAVARQWGVDYIISHKINRGLAAAFATGIDHALRLGADIIVNTDGDNQYPGHQIPWLILPILENNADMVIGDRQTWRAHHFSLCKRLLQRLGSFVISGVARQAIPDAVSGFRAFSRQSAMRLNIVTSFSYTIETILQASQKGLKIESVPIRSVATSRRSRLFCNMPQFVFRSGATILQVYLMYHSFAVFVWLGLPLLIVGAIPMIRFFYLFALGNGGGHIQSLIIGGVLLVLGWLTLVFGVIAELLSVNRALSEIMLESTRRFSLEHTLSIKANYVLGQDKCVVSSM